MTLKLWGKYRNDTPFRRRAEKKDRTPSASEVRAQTGWRRIDQNEFCMITIVSVLAFAAWVYLIGFHVQFWRSSQVIGGDAPPGTARVAAIVPARNEAEN